MRPPPNKRKSPKGSLFHTFQSIKLTWYIYDGYLPIVPTHYHTVNNPNWKPPTQTTPQTQRTTAPDNTIDFTTPPSSLSNCHGHDTRQTADKVFAGKCHRICAILELEKGILI